MYISSSFLMYLCIPCYSDACLKASALRVGVKTLHNTIQWLNWDLHSAHVDKKVTCGSAALRKCGFASYSLFL